MIATTDVCDTHGDAVQVLAPGFGNYGKTKHFAGSILTVKALEDNVIMRAMLEQPGDGRVLVVDGGGSLRCALLGDMIAKLAQANGWAGIVLNAAVRDVEALSQIDIGIRALGVHPRKSKKHGAGEKDIPVAFAGVTFTPGNFLVSDADGIVVTPASLEIGQV